jgi:hypothetical protein
MVDSLAFVHGKFEDQFEPGAADVVIGRLGRKPVEPRHLAVGFLTDFLRQVGRLQALAEQFQFGFAFLAAQFLLDGAQLLAQDVFALLLAHFVLSFGGDFAADFQNLQFVRKVRVDQIRSASARDSAASSECSRLTSILSTLASIQASCRGSSWP